VTTRTSSAVVVFRRPFILDGFEGLQAAGSYIIETEEELIEAVSFPAWRRISTVLQLHRHGQTQYVPVSPDLLREDVLHNIAQPDPLLLSLSGEKDHRARNVGAAPALGDTH
jgi:hypothetical protein